MNVEIYLIKRHFKLQDRIGSHKTRKNKKTTIYVRCNIITMIIVIRCIYAQQYVSDTIFTIDKIILWQEFRQDVRYTVNRIADVMMILVHNNMTHKQHNFVAFLPHYLLCLYTVNNTRNNESTTTISARTHFVLFI